MAMKRFFAPFSCNSKEILESGRKQVQQLANFFKQYVPGFERAYLAQTGVQVGVRESRRIIGHYYLTADDLLNAKKFDDGIYP